MKDNKLKLFVNKEKMIKNCGKCGRGNSIKVLPLGIEKSKLQEYNDNEVELEILYMKAA